MSVGPVGAVGAGSVSPERTPVSVASLRQAIGRAYQRVTGQAPSATLLQSLTAQASLETGAGSSMYNYNFGGVKGAGPFDRSSARTDRWTKAPRITSACWCSGSATRSRPPQGETSTALRTP